MQPSFIPSSKHIDRKRSPVARVAVSLLLLLLIVAVVNQLYLDTFLSSTLHYRQEQQLKEFVQATKLCTLFVGDSHTMYGVDPTNIPHSFNIGGGSNSYAESYYKLKKILDAGIQPKNIILEIDRHSFSSYFFDSPIMAQQSWLYAQFTPINVIADISNSTHVAIWLRSKFPFIGHGAEWIAHSTEYSDLHLGWLSLNSTLDITVRPDNVYPLMSKVFNENGMDERQVYFYKQILLLAKKNNLTIVLVAYPISPPFIDAITNKKIDLVNYYSTIFSITDAIYPDYAALDYVSLYYKKPEFFFDYDHLNSVGAHFFSERLYNDLRPALGNC